MCCFLDKLTLADLLNNCKRANVKYERTDLRLVYHPAVSITRQIKIRYLCFSLSSPIVGCQICFLF